MKFLPSVVSYFLKGESTRQNIRMLLRFFLVLFVMITAYSVIFHLLMAAEGQRHSWLTGLYWTMVVMSTLGFGDITFHSDVGRIFSILVLLSGVIFLLILLPFAFIKFFFAPWIEAETRKRYAQELPPGTKNHVIITSYDQVTMALIEKLGIYKRDYVVIVDEYERSKELYDAGVRIAVGHIDDPETYRKMRAEQAAMVVATNRDEMNTNIAFTVREITETVPVVATSDSPHSVDILYLAGCTRVLELTEILGRSLAGWTIGGDFRANVLGRFDNLIIAEAPAISTPLVGKTLAESRLREEIGVTVIAVWERGRFVAPTPEAAINRSTALVFAGTEEQIARYDEVYGFYQLTRHAGDPVIIIGGGRVGKAIAQRFKEREVDYLIVEKNPRRAEDDACYITGDAADIGTLKRAWIEKTPAALITTHDDATNIYLAKYLRSLRPDMQIICRANTDRNISTLHRAGADFVMSYASLGANAIFNYLRKEDMFMLAEGLNIFTIPLPPALAGKTLAQSRIRPETGCSVIGIRRGDNVAINPDPFLPVEADSELILIGSPEAELSFSRTYL